VEGNHAPVGQNRHLHLLMSQTALNSEYCQAEFREAYRLRKQIITVQVDANLDIDNDQLSAMPICGLDARALTMPIVVRSYCGR
jgi:hypothetical protein